MTRGHPFSDDLRQVLIYMGTRCTFSEVMAQTGVPRSTLRALFAEYKKNGHVLCTKESAYEMRGRKRKLTIANVGVLILAKFLTGNIWQRNDLYLDELQDLVSSRLGISVDDLTIWRTLHRQGFTMKKLSQAALERNEDR
ncbi:uncharacterized protein C8R40DRAFT_1065406 [Lentinula edodes]|uniref:uncharacterized protein n=1 Tax=Lentinula edodes TaxID=5353 RepID=UPI001E8DE1AF|nr:uncharacterized protein C8R40DRAFT_1065406 [Lentinula edodes]KAH7880332.1 hypothetical protein C8R40DRAFT_1065406 [Lentinula edodes]